MNQNNISLERVIKGLECHARAMYGEIDEYGLACNQCPYKDMGNTCHSRTEGDLISDALDLLKAQEPRVMSIGDLYGYDMGFYERRDEELVWPVLISRGGPDGDETVGFVRKDGYELRSDCGLMNITWRMWTAYPPYELREETPWQ